MVVFAAAAVAVQTVEARSCVVATWCCRGWWWPATKWRDSDAVVADEMKRCGGGCHGDGRRGEN